MLKNLLVYPAILAVTIYVGVLNRQTWAILLFFAEILLFLLQIAAVIYQRIHLNLNVKLPQSALLGEEQAVTEISFWNIGLLPIQRLEIRAQYRCLTSKVKRRGIRKPKEEVKVWGKIDSEDTQSYEICSGPFPSGQFLFSVPYVRIYDYLGIFSMKIRVRKSQNITVLPNFVTMPLLLSGREVPMDGEADITRKGQDPIEIYDIREYQAGDSLRGIYWKRSANKETLLYREHAAQRGVSAVLFLQLPQKEEPVLFHYELKIAGSFMMSLLQNGWRHFLVWEPGEASILERKLIENEQDMFEVIMELLNMAAERKNKKNKKKKEREKGKKNIQKGKRKGKKEHSKRKEIKIPGDFTSWQEKIRFQYEMQFQGENCPEAFFLLGGEKNALILEQETEPLIEFLKGKKLRGSRQEEQRLEEEMRGV